MRSEVTKGHACATLALRLAATTLRASTLSVHTFRVNTFRGKTFGVKTFCVKTFGVKTFLCIKLSKCLKNSSNWFEKQFHTGLKSYTYLERIGIPP